jgi:peptide-methionine (R)-S-oxide reductase
MSDLDKKSEDYWRETLSADEFRVCRQKGTEIAGSGDYYHLQDEGRYLCKCCGEELFTSASKYHSGSGWPSFYATTSDRAINETVDQAHGMTRTEITCSNCGCHLGHVFPDGPKPTGLRYCVNSLSLQFEPKK